MTDNERSIAAYNQGPKKMMSRCPFCDAKQEMDKLHTWLYACGTTGDRDKGQYYRRCG